MDQQGMAPAKTLHPCIVEFQEKINSDLGNILLSIKWIGNGSSHGADSLPRPDVVAAMAMLDYVISQLFDTETPEKEQQLRDYSAGVNAAKEPIERNARI
jgi:hypothetical protein